MKNIIKTINEIANKGIVIKVENESIEGIVDAKKFFVSLKPKFITDKKISLERPMGLEVQIRIFDVVVYGYSAGMLEPKEEIEILKTFRDVKHEILIIEDQKLENTENLSRKYWREFTI